MKQTSRLLVVLTGLTLAVLFWGVFQLVASNYFAGLSIPEVHALFVSHGLVCALLLAAWAGFFVLRSRRKFEEAVAEKQALFDRQMADTEKMAAIGKIAAGVAHQLNTPLGSIMLTAEMLDEELNGNDEFHQEVQKILRNTHYCKGVVRNLLLYAKPHREADREESICFVIRRVATLFDHEMKKRGIQFETVVDCNECAVFCNVNLIEQLIFNLIQNAVDAQPNGGRITVRTIVGGNGRLCIFVNDGGAGIPPDVMPHIFEPFFTTKAADKGTGLGLAVAQRIAEDHGGSIRVESAPDRGSTFIVDLPATPPSVNPLAAASIGGD